MYAFDDDSPLVRDLALAPVITMPANVTLGAVAAALTDTGAPVVLLEAGRAVGVDRDDLVRALAAGAQSSDPAAGFGHTPVIVEAHTTLLASISSMLRAGHDAVIVVDAKDRLVGALGYRIATRTLAAASRWVGALRVALHLEQAQ